MTPESQIETSRAHSVRERAKTAGLRGRLVTTLPAVIRLATILEAEGYSPSDALAAASRLGAGYLANPERGGYR